jgi:hypothetical protein
MKIIAYSKVPSHTPFVHLAYISTTAFKPATGLLVAGMVLVVTGLCLLSRGFSRYSARWIQFTQRIRVGRWSVRTVAPAAIVLGLAGVALSVVFGNQAYRMPWSLTHIHMEVLARSIEQADQSQGRIVVKLPSETGVYDVTSVCEGSQGLRRLCMDAWKMPMKLRVSKESNQLHFSLLSSGPDRKLSTEDDLVKDLSPPEHD